MFANQYFGLHFFRRWVMGQRWFRAWLSVMRSSCFGSVSLTEPMSGDVSGVVFGSIARLAARQTVFKIADTRAS